MSKKVNKTQDLFSVMEFETNSVVEESNKEILVDFEKKLNPEDKKINKKNNKITENNSDKMEQKEL